MFFFTIRRSSFQAYTSSKVSAFDNTAPQRQATTTPEYIYYCHAMAGALQIHMWRRCYYRQRLCRPWPHIQLTVDDVQLLCSFGGLFVPFQAAAPNTRHCTGMNVSSMWAQRVKRNFNVLRSAQKFYLLRISISLKYTHIQHIHIHHIL